MASDKGSQHDSLDERLAAARDSALDNGEKIIAQEEGDQGQGIVLTDSRVLVIKVGITATGTANGSLVGRFLIGEVTAVNVRKGPLGQVIQICNSNGEPASSPGTAPDNVIVFTGSQRMKKCEAIAAMIEAAIGKPAARVEGKPGIAEQPAASEPVPEASSDVALSAIEETMAPTEAPPVESEQESDESIPSKSPSRAPRQATSLADQLFAELQGAQAEAAKPDAPLPVVPMPESPAPIEEPVAACVAEPAVIAEPEEAGEPEAEAEPERFAPNPHLPRPVRRGNGRERVLVLFGLLGAALVVGIAVTAPMRVKRELPSVTVSSTSPVTSVPVLRRQMTQVDDYLATCRSIVQQADKALATFDGAVKSGNGSAIAAATKTDAVGQAWRKLDKLQAPRGLAGAREQMVSGTFIAKNAVANVAGAVQSSTPIGPHESLARTQEARERVRRGLDTVVKMQADLEKQIEQRRSKSAHSDPEPK